MNKFFKITYNCDKCGNKGTFFTFRKNRLIWCCEEPTIQKTVPDYDFNEKKPIKIPWWEPIKNGVKNNDNKV